MSSRLLQKKVSKSLCYLAYQKAAVALQCILEEAFSLGSIVLNDPSLLFLWTHLARFKRRRKKKKRIQRWSVVMPGCGDAWFWVCRWAAPTVIWAETSLSGSAPPYRVLSSTSQRSCSNVACLEWGAEVGLGPKTGSQQECVRGRNLQRPPGMALGGPLFYPWPIPILGGWGLPPRYWAHPAATHEGPLPLKCLPVSYLCLWVPFAFSSLFPSPVPLRNGNTDGDIYMASCLTCLQVAPWGTGKQKCASPFLHEAVTLLEETLGRSEAQQQKPFCSKCY